MLASQSDPRVFFAAERTLLAWLRTSLAIMAFGFVIARFGLFLQIVSLQAQVPRLHVHSTLSAMLGIAFVVIGLLAALIATVQHRRFISTLAAADLPPSYSSVFVLAFGFLMSVLGLVLALYLAVSQT